MFTCEVTMRCALRKRIVNACYKKVTLQMQVQVWCIVLLQWRLGRKSVVILAKIENSNRPIIRGAMFVEFVDLGGPFSTARNRKMKYTREKESPNDNEAQKQLGCLPS